MLDALRKLYPDLAEGAQVAIHDIGFPRGGLHYWQAHCAHPGSSEHEVLMVLVPLYMGFVEIGKQVHRFWHGRCDHCQKIHLGFRRPPSKKA